MTNKISRKEEILMKKLCFTFVILLVFALAGCGGGGGGGGGAATVGPIIESDDNVPPDLVTKASDDVINKYIVGTWRREGSYSYSEGGLTLTATKDVTTYDGAGNVFTEVIATAYLDGDLLRLKLIGTAKYSIEAGVISYSQAKYDMIETDTNSYLERDSATIIDPEIINSISADAMKITYLEDDGNYYGARFYKL